MMYWRRLEIQWTLYFIVNTYDKFSIKASVSALFISYEFTGHQAAFLHTTQEKEKASLFDSSHASHR